MSSRACGRAVVPPTLALSARAEYELLVMTFPNKVDERGGSARGAVARQR